MRRPGELSTRDTAKIFGRCVKTVVRWCREAESLGGKYDAPPGRIYVRRDIGGRFWIKLEQ